MGVTKLSNASPIGSAVATLDGVEVGHFYIYNDVDGEYVEGMHYVRLVVFDSDAGVRQHTFEHFVHWNRENGGEAFGLTPMAVIEHLPLSEQDEAREAAEAFMTEDYPLLLSGELDFEPI
jgi:hypothetical protein